jgi:plasmid stabilization system protein ParE
MSRHAIVSPEAEAQINAIDSWWRANRQAAPHLFAEELAEAIRVLELAPQIGRRYPHPHVKGVRRVPLAGDATSRLLRANARCGHSSCSVGIDQRVGPGLVIGLTHVVANA